MEEIAERGAMFLPIMMQATEEDGTRDHTPCSCYFGDRSEREFARTWQVHTARALQLSLFPAQYKVVEHAPRSWPRSAGQLVVELDSEPQVMYVSLPN